MIEEKLKKQDSIIISLKRTINEWLFKQIKKEKSLF